MKITKILIWHMYVNNIDCLDYFYIWTTSAVTKIGKIIRKVFKNSHPYLMEFWAHKSFVHSTKSWYYFMPKKFLFELISSLQCRPCFRGIPISYLIQFFFIFTNIYETLKFFVCITFQNLLVLSTKFWSHRKFFIFNSMQTKYWVPFTKK